MVGPGDFGRRFLSVLGVARVLGRWELGLQLVVVHLVEPLRDPLRCSPVVDENDRRVVLPDQAQQLRIDRGPDRASVRGRVERRLDRAGVDALRGVLQLRVLVRRLAGVGAVATLVRQRAGLDHVLDGNDDLEVQLLRLRGIHDLALSPRADEEVADALQRPLGRRQTDPLDVLVPRRSSRSSVSARCEPRFDGATAWISSTITASTPPRISRACELIIR